MGPCGGTTRTIAAASTVGKERASRVAFAAIERDDERAARPQAVCDILSPWFSSQAAATVLTYAFAISLKSSAKDAAPSSAEIETSSRELAGEAIRKFAVFV